MGSARDDGRLDSAPSGEKVIPLLFHGIECLIFSEALAMTSRYRESLRDRGGRERRCGPQIRVCDSESCV